MDRQLLNGLFQQDPWVATAAVALLAVVAALVAHRVGHALLLRATHGSPVLHAIVQATASAAAAALPLAALQLVWTAAPDGLRHIQALRHVNGLLLHSTMGRIKPHRSRAAVRNEQLEYLVESVICACAIQ